MVKKYLSENKNNINQDNIKLIGKINKKKGRTALEREYENHKLIDIKNLKTKFRRSAKNYKLSSNDKLLYKTKIKIFINKSNSYNISYDYLHVPTVKELNNYLYEFHCNNFHCNEKDLIQIFKDNKINFYGLQSLIQEYVYKCPVCTQNTKTVHREEPVKAISVEGPNQRYEFDLTYLNDDLESAYGVKYILSVIDVFSRKAMIYKHNSKTSENILKDIIEFCIYNGFPKEFVSDNGPEFKNSKMNDFCIREGIRYIHGVPYNPHAQGTIERFHYTIKKYLAKEYINNNYKKLNFEEVRIKVIKFYNNKKHRIIGMSPNESSKITDLDEIKKINAIKEKLFDKINKKRNFLGKSSTALLNPKFILMGKETLIPNYIKKGKFKKKIPVKIIERVSYGYYRIKIYVDYKDKKIKFSNRKLLIADSKLL